MKVTKQKLFEYEDTSVKKYTLSNDSGMTMEVLDLGCVIYSLKVPDRNGKLTDVVLGYQDPKMYINNPVFFGAVIGRYSNRIAKGKFDWHGSIIQLETNDGNNHLHGGSEGFSGKIWQCISDHDVLTFKINSPDCDSNYPGEVECYVSYLLSDTNELIIKYKVTTPSESIANLTNHSYFNLNGDGTESILNHHLEINSDQFTEITSEAIPTGKLLSVDDTPLDFRSSKLIGQDIEDNYEQLRMVDGYDHNYILKQDKEYDVIAYSNETGIQLEMSSNSPGMQLYTGNAITEGLIGKTGKVYKRRSGFCLETQFYPDSPNHKHFPQPILTKNNPQEFETRFKFSIRD